MLSSQVKYSLIQKTSSVSKELFPLVPLYNWTHCRTQMKMAEATMNPFDRLESSDVDYFKEVDLDVLQNSRDENNDTLLSKAAILDELECCREIYNRCPVLIWRQNAFLNTALHHAIYYEASVEFVSFLIDAALKRDLQCDPERRKKWLAVQNYKGDTALSYAVMRRNVKVTKVLMEFDYDHAMLRIANYKKQTPLHLAVQSQNLELVKLLTVPADFRYFPNKDGETPLLMAMRVALSGDSTAVEIRKFLLKAQARECKVRIGTKGWTALHHASRDGDVDTIDDIIQFCPDCIQMVDPKGHNFLHVAVKFDRVDVVKHVLERREISACVLNGQDQYGCTPLHAAVTSGNRNMVLFLLYDPRVNKLSLNADGRRVIDLIKFDYDKKKAGVYGAMDIVYPTEMMEHSKFYLLVYAVIATISFTGITFPMVFNNEETDNVAMPLLSKRAFPLAFVLPNAFALVLALCAGFCHICARSLVRKKDITGQLMVSTMCIIGAVFAMVVAHLTGWCALWGISDGLAIIIFQMCCCFFVFALYPLLRMLKETRHSVALE